jgi:membrane protein YqaA with SNARE-associated domain
MFRSLYDWTLRLAHHRHAVRSMAAVSFAESSFFPIPPDVVLVPVVLANRDRAYWIATVCTVASVLGGILGYVIGAFLWESIGLWLAQLYHLEEKMEDLRGLYGEWGTAVILIKGLTPIPFKLVTIASGVFSFNFPLFVLLAAITRGFRFFLIAFLLKKFGEPVQEFIERRLNLIGFAVLIALIAGFAAVAWL